MKPFWKWKQDFFLQRANAGKTIILEVLMMRIKYQMLAVMHTGQLRCSHSIFGEWGNKHETPPGCWLGIHESCQSCAAKTKIVEGTRLNFVALWPARLPNSSPPGKWTNFSHITKNKKEESKFPSPIFFLLLLLRATVIPQGHILSNLLYKSKSKAYSCFFLCTRPERRH